MGIVEYEPRTPFPGVIGRTTDESSPTWPAPIRARQGTANVLTVVLDDTGYGQLGCYGSPIATPNFDALAADGLRYNNMRTGADRALGNGSGRLTGRLRGHRQPHIADPVVFYLVGGEQAKTQLDSAKGWLAVHNDAVMTLLFLVFGVNLVAKGIPRLTR